MDSGVVDVGVFNHDDEARYLPGDIKKPALVIGYDAKFSKPSTAPWWVTPNSKTSDGQLSGEILKSSTFIGRVRTDGVANSFTPNEIVDGDPPEKKLNEADDNLVYKKKAAYFCPPSMFTGRARLYAQAMFGRYLYENKDVKSYNKPPQLIFSAGPPSLKLPLYDNKDAKAVEDFRKIVDAERAAAEAAGYGLIFEDPYDIPLNVSSGVFLDTKTGRHWLINLTSTQAIIHDLKGSSSAEQLRVFLSEKKSGKLNEEDRGHLEAYILSSCRPVAESRKVCSLNHNGINPYSMGYGWHWNWSGTNADIVINGTFLQSGSNFGMESTHYRISMTMTSAKQEDGLTEFAFSFYTGTVEGPTRWSVYRRSWSITNPSWINRQTNFESDWPVYWTEKTTTRLAEFMEASGFFYVFYKKDVVQVCRVTTSETEETPAVDNVSGDEYWTLAGGYLRSSTGGADGFHEHTNTVGRYKECEFSIGGVSVGSVSYGHVEAGHEERIHDKVDLGISNPWSFALSYGVGHHLQYGSPQADGTWAYATEDGFLGFVNPHVWHATITADDFHKEWYESAAVAIPFYDAEAVYCRRYSRLDKRKTNVGNKYWGMDFSSSSCVTLTPPDIENRQPSSAIYTRYYSTYPGWWTSSWKPDDDTPDYTETTETIVDKFHFRSGAVDATLGDAGFALGDIFSTEPDLLDYILGLAIPARSSTDFATPTAFGLMPTVGANDADIIGNTALVGWV